MAIAQMRHHAVEFGLQPIGIHRQDARGDAFGPVDGLIVEACGIGQVERTDDGTRRIGVQDEWRMGHDVGAVGHAYLHFPAATHRGVGRFRPVVVAGAVTAPR